MRYAVALAAAFFLAAFSVSAMPYVKVLGATPDLVLIFAACWTAVRGRSEAMLVIPLAGLMKDLAGSGPLGMSALGMAVMVPLSALVEIRAMDSQFLPAVIIVALASLTNSLVSMAVLAAMGEGLPVLEALRWAVVPGIVVNALFTAVIYVPLSWFGPKQRPGFLDARGLTAL